MFFNFAYKQVGKKRRLTYFRSITHCNESSTVAQRRSFPAVLRQAVRTMNIASDVSSVFRMEHLS